MKLNFKPSFDCIINVNNIALDASNGKLSIDADENANILVYPLAGKNEKYQLLPYAFRVQNLLNCETAPSYIKIVVIKDEAEITLLPYPLFSQKCGYLLNEEKLFYQGKNYSVKINSCGEDNILVYQDGVLLLRHTIINPTEALISQIDKYVIISGKTSKPFAIIIDLNLIEVCLFKECDRIEVDHANKKILCLTDLKTSLNHGFVEIYKLGEKLENETSYPTFLRQAKISNINCVRVFNFFDSVKAKDFTSAKSLLAPKLAQLTNETLEKYFENFSEIRQGKIDNEYYLLQDKSVCIAEKFLFEFSGNLISNIKPI